MSDETRMLAAWADQYIQTDWKRFIYFVNYKELAITDGFRMGYIECEWNETTEMVIGRVWLDDDHAKCPVFFRNAVLWHEFCHFWDCVEMMHVDHCSNFQKKKLKKPLYAFGDVVLKLIGWVWFD